MALRRSVQSRIIITKEEEPKKQEVPRPSDEEKVSPRAVIGKRFCHFCKTHTKPSYTDTVVLRRYLNDRGRINPRTRSGACSKHQRQICREIKRARHLALLPFTIRI